MSLKKLIPLFVIMGMLLAVPAQAQARTNRSRSDITIDSVLVSDYNGDGVKGDALIQGTLTLVSDKPQTNVRCVISYYLTYLPDGTYAGQLSSGTNWVFYKTYTGLSSSSSGVDNPYTYSILNLPYPGWYKVRSATFANGKLVISEAFLFDPPGGGPGPIGC